MVAILWASIIQSDVTNSGVNRYPTTCVRGNKPNRYELNQDCKRAVRFVDDSTVEVDGHHGAKQFVFDSVFSEEHGQAAIFEDTRNLVQSALDG